MRSTSQWIKLWENRSTVDHTCKQEYKDFFCRNFSNQRTCFSNSMALTLTQPKIRISFKNSGCMQPIALMSSYAKEKEKNMTTLAIHHWVLLLTIPIPTTDNSITATKPINSEYFVWIANCFCKRTTHEHDYVTGFTAVRSATMNCNFNPTTKVFCPHPSLSCYSIWCNPHNRRVSTMSYGLIKARIVLPRQYKSWNQTNLTTYFLVSYE